MRVVVLRPGRTKPDEPPRPTMAPDGTPVSTLQMPQLTWPLIDVVLLANLKCRMRIELRKFDPAIYVLAPPLPPTKHIKIRRERPNFSTEPEAKLLTWTVAKIRTLPEFNFINGPSDDKATLVKQILRVRDRA